MAALEAAAPLGVLEVFVHHDISGAWIFTPLARTVPLEVREATDGVPPADCCGVIWRLDEQVLLETKAADVEDERTLDERDDFALDKNDYLCLAGEVCGRMKRVAADMKRMKTVAAKLQSKLSNFEEQQEALQLEQRRLDESRAALARQQAELRGKFAQLEDERARFKAEVAQTELGRETAMQMQAADIFFSASQDEFVSAVPQLSKEDEVELQHARLTPEAAFVAAREAFFQADRSSGLSEQPQQEDAKGRLAQIQPQIDAVVRALLALHCLDNKQEGSARFVQALEHLSGISQVLAGLANRSARLPLAFAASSCAMWCALNLMDKLTQRWDEAQTAELIRELEGLDKLPEDGLGQIARRARQLAQHSSAARRLLRVCAEHPDHRRRFLRFMASRGVNGAADADLRLLLLARDASPTELAAHVRRLSTFVDENAVSSRRKRSRPASSEGLGESRERVDNGTRDPRSSVRPARRSLASAPPRANAHGLPSAAGLAPTVP